MMVGQISTKIGNCIENRHIFMLLNCNCARLDNFEHFETFARGGGVFVDTVCRPCMYRMPVHTCAYCPNYSLLSLSNIMYMRLYTMAKDEEKSRCCLYNENCIKL